jgi:uncharacterized heparinase superfamily protein
MKFPPSLIARTVSHLKFRQITYQLIRRFGPKAKIPAVAAPVVIRRGLELVPPQGRKSGGENYSFSFLNVTRHFDPARFDWSPSEMSKLWRYNLHYFDYLKEEGRQWESKAFLISDWIEKNPQGTPDAWEPFPLSLRIVNWIKLFLSPEVKGNVEEPWLKSLYEQALWLEKNIEYHLLANHYFKNGKALIFAGLYFAGPDAERWLKKGLQIIFSELDEQILPDGGHFERSPMYHAMILEDCLDMLNLGLGAGDWGLTGRGLGTGVAGLCDRLREKCRSMVRFLLAMTHPNGDIALFNDAAFGIEARPADLIAYYERVTGGASAPTGDQLAFPETGYFVMAPRLGDRLIIDCGPVGPDYQPGHSHCDNLSFELSLKGRRVIVDSGCCQYMDSDIRRYNRGNKGHNTLTIDDRNQSEVWGAHRCARRAYPLHASLDKRTDGSLQFSGAHNGYRYLNGKPVHHRNVTWSEDVCLIDDRVEGKGTHDIETRLHIHPDLKVELDGDKVVISCGIEVMAAITLQGNGRIERCEGWYCPEFGVKVTCTVLKAGFENVPLPFSSGWVISTGG